MSGTRPAADAEQWQAVAATRIGERHRAAAAANQDAFATCTREGATALAVADGHGHPDHFRSGPGAAIAARIAADLVAEAGSTSYDRDSLAETLAGSTAAALVDRWRHETLEHFAEHPFTVEETARSGVGDPGVWVAYGTTVIALVGTSTCLGILQVGDGDAVTVGADGLAEHPLPDDEANRGGVTSSLGQLDPLAAVRTTVLDVSRTPLALAWVATDGFGSARVEPHTWWRDVSRDLAAHLETHGLAWVEARLPGWLEEPATVGGDDVTLGLIVPRDRP